VLDVRRGSEAIVVARNGSPVVLEWRARNVRRLRRSAWCGTPAGSSISDDGEVALVRADGYETATSTRADAKPIDDHLDERGLRQKAIRPFMRKEIAEQPRGPRVP